MEYQNILETLKTKKILGAVKSVERSDLEFVIHYETGEKAKVNVLNDHVFRYHMSPSGKFLEYPEPHRPNEIAKITVKRVTDYDKKAFQDSTINEDETGFMIETDKIQIEFNKSLGLMSVFDKRTDTDINVLSESKPLSYDYFSRQELVYQNEEYFFGCGMHKGTFMYNGQVVDIENSSDWNDTAVPSPCPFYWSSDGYGVLRNTWQPGNYNFGSKSSDTIKTAHKGEDFDAFYFINPLPQDILNDYFELTGKPILMPEYAFYEATINNFNRNIVVNVSPDVKDDSKYNKRKRYNSAMADATYGRLERFNSENTNKQLSASTGVSKNGFTDINGIELAMWTDILTMRIRERVLSKDVECGERIMGYSYGLNAVEGAEAIAKTTNPNKRPMIITDDGWAGTQRYAGIWSADHYCGNWDSIRFNIPTYIGAGLSGQPIVGSNMDGIYSGKNREINIRDYQWKTFTPLQLNTNGWGDDPKNPFSCDMQAIAIHTAYSKLKSMLMPYNYSIGHEATHGLPMIRAMFLEFPELLAFTEESQYQFMWGPNILVAPIYNQKGVMGASLRDGIYLPDENQVWIDFFTGEKYQGGKVLNGIRTPLWKIPVFVKEGAIIPMSVPSDNPNEIKRDSRIFNIYPKNESTFDVYEDDGISSDYLDGQFATTKIKVVGPSSNACGELFLTIDRTIGSYNTMEKERTTLLRIIASKECKNITASINGMSINITKAETEEQLETNDNIYFFKEDYLVNPYLNNVCGEVRKQKFLFINIQKTDVTTNKLEVQIQGYTNEGDNFGSNSTVLPCLNPPADFTCKVRKAEIIQMTLYWHPENKANYYEIIRGNFIFTNITGPGFSFDCFNKNSRYCFRIRSVNEKGVSDWSEWVEGTIDTEDPYKHLENVKGIRVSCQLKCEPGQEVSHLTDSDPCSQWQTCLKEADHVDFVEGNIVTLKFDLREIYLINKIEYVPLEPPYKGSILQVQYRFSVDGSIWSSFSDTIYWKCNYNTKTIEFDEKIMRYLELNILDSDGGFCSGNKILFYRSETVKDVKVTCNIPCQPGEAVCKLTDGNKKTLWHTDYDLTNVVDDGEGNTVDLHFDLGYVYELEKMEYHPRSHGQNGIFTTVNYKYSMDGEKWSPVSEDIYWEDDSTVKTIHFYGVRFRYFSLSVLAAVNGWASGRQILFHRDSPLLPAMKRDPYQYVLRGVTATCSVPCEPGTEIWMLTDHPSEKKSKHMLWHTRWNMPQRGGSITINFDLGKVVPIEKLEYYPRDDGTNGTFLEIQYKHSADWKNWSQLSDDITWRQDENVKTIHFGGVKFRFLELEILASVGGFASGKQILFYTQPESD